MCLLQVTIGVRWLIDKKTESYIDIVDWTWYIHVMIDTWLHSWPDLDILFCYWLPLLLSVMFSYYFSLIPVYIIIIYDHTIYARAPSSLFYTLIGSLSDDPAFACLDRMLYFIIQVFDETVHVVRRWSLSLLDYQYSCSFIHIIFWFSLYRIELPFLYYFICYHVWLLIYYIAVFSYHYNDYITCSSCFRLNVYTWGILLAYIRRQLSSRPRF